MAGKDIQLPNESGIIDPRIARLSAQQSFHRSERARQTEADLRRSASPARKIARNFRTFTRGSR